MISSGGAIGVVRIYGSGVEEVEFSTCGKGSRGGISQQLVGRLTFTLGICTDKMPILANAAIERDQV
jgi:hypothetical protein